MREALEAVLLFYHVGLLDISKRLRWLEITGNEKVTTKVLCDHIRLVLEEEGENTGGT